MIMRRNALAGFTLFACFGGGIFGASAAPVYIGLQEAGVNGGAITNESGANGGNGLASLTNFLYGNGPSTYFQVNVTATGTNNGTLPLPEPDLNSTAISLTSQAAGTLNIYVTELNQFPLSFSQFQSTFNTSALTGTGASVVESTYVTPCASGPCPAANIFAEGTLLSQTTFNGTGTVVDYAALPLTLSAPYSTTEVFTITLPSKGGSTSAIDLTAVTPLPAAFPLFAGGLSLLGGFGLWRKRRRSALATA